MVKKAVQKSDNGMCIGFLVVNSNESIAIFIEQSDLSGNRNSLLLNDMLFSSKDSKMLELSIGFTIFVVLRPQLSFFVPCSSSFVFGPLISCNTQIFMGVFCRNFFRSLIQKPDSFGEPKQPEDTMLNDASTPYCLDALQFGCSC